MNYLTLGDFAQTLPEETATRFVEKYRKISKASPKTYQLLNTELKWKTLLQQVLDCDLLCTYGCDTATKPDLLTCENIPVGCVLMTAGNG